MKIKLDKKMDRIKYLKSIMEHRTRVGNKMSVLANDIVERGRRHDSSYGDSTEQTLAIRAAHAETPEDYGHSISLLNHLHAVNNDYIPDCHDHGLADMNFAQLMEYICDRMATREEEYVEDNGNVVVDLRPEDYYDYVLLGFPDDTPPILCDIIRSTIRYIRDRNNVIRAMIDKRNALENAEREMLAKVGEMCCVEAEEE